jgi:hypothetical protein
VLADRAARAGYRLLTVESVGSTNEEALDRARAGETGGLWIRAEVQTNGRGRLGRHWTSPPGNLYVTLLLVDPAPVRHIPALGFVLASLWHGRLPRQQAPLRASRSNGPTICSGKAPNSQAFFWRARRPRRGVLRSPSEWV